MHKLFKNREEAAVQLAILLSKYKNKNALVLALPSGGVPIGHIIAKELNIPLDISLCKKTISPDQEYIPDALNMEKSILNHSTETEFIQFEINRIKESLKKLYQFFSGDYTPIDLKDKIVIIADDGIVTGNNTISTVRMAKKQGAAEVIVAAPVISPSATNILKNDADQVIALTVPRYFMAVSQFYEDFRAVENEEVIRMLFQSKDWPLNRKTFLN